MAGAINIPEMTRHAAAVGSKWRKRGFISDKESGLAGWRWRLFYYPGKTYSRAFARAILISARKQVVRRSMMASAASYNLMMKRSIISISLTILVWSDVASLQQDVALVQKHRERKMNNETSVAMASVAAVVAGCAGVGFGQKLAISQELVNQHLPAQHALYLQDRWRMQVLNGRSSRSMLNFKTAHNIFQDTAWP